MAYTKLGWANDRAPALNQTNLNHMDQGIYDANSKLEEYEDIFTADVDESVRNWLDDHPEATTTVEDNSLTIQKLVKPLQLRALISLNGMSFSDPIALPIVASYVEAVTFLNGKYYAVCKDYTTPPNKTYVAIYDSEFNLLSYDYTNSLYGVANNAFNDGNRIYIDFDNGYHVSFNQSMADDFAVLNSNIRNMAYWNETLYGITINASDVVVSELDSDFVTVLSSFTVSTVRQTLQSASIIDGILMIPTTKGIFKFIDVEARSLIAEVPYYSSKEIENFFKDNDGIKCAGHFYGYDGQFNVGAFDNGIDYAEMRYAPADGSIGKITLTGSERYGFYKVTNGTQMNLPEDVGDLIVFENTKIFMTSTKNIYAFQTNNTWQLVGGLTNAGTSVTATIDGSNGTITLRKTGDVCQLYLSLSRSSVGTSLTAPITIATLPEGYRPRTEIMVPLMCRDVVAWASTNVSIISAQIQTNGNIRLFGSDTVLTNGKAFWGAASYLIN